MNANDDSPAAELAPAAAGSAHAQEILLSQIGTEQWKIETSDNVPLMAVPTLLRLQANLLERALTKAG